MGGTTRSIRRGRLQEGHMGLHPVDAGSNPVRVNDYRDAATGNTQKSFPKSVAQRCPVSVVDARNASNVVDRVRFLDWVLN